MSLLDNYFYGILCVVLCVSTCSADNDDGFLNVTCTQAKDCYVLEDPYLGLHLNCWYNVNKCKCSNSFRSNFHLKWENNKCLMSKYGPCGEKTPELAVGCQDGFVCVDNQCRDPNDTSLKAVKLTPFRFEESKCSEGDCAFDDNLSLSCSDGDHCSCEKVYIADAGDSYWDIRNYDGNYNCSVGKFGPCGTRNGITIDCHGDGITCVNGTCLKSNHPISDLGEDCESNEHCKEGLLCSEESVCIEPFSLPTGKLCSNSMHCQKGLECRKSGPWSSAFCEETNN